jgi:dipeptidyl aminopeptidase/acylaminoacyl peptidase
VHSRHLLAMAAAVLAATSIAQAQQRPPAEAFAALPAMDSPSLSPEGDRLAFLSHGPQGSYVLVLDLGSMALTGAIDMTALKPRRVTWANSESLLTFVGQAVSLPGVVAGPIESTAPYGIDLSVPNRASARQLLLARQGGAQSIGGYVFVQGAQLIGYQRDTGRVLFPMFENDGRRSLYAVDVKTDRRQRIDRAPLTTRDWVVDESGNPLYRVDFTDRADRFQLLTRRSGRWEVLVQETVAIPQLRLYGLNPAGELIVGVSPEEVGRFGLYVMSGETGETLRPFFVHERSDVIGVMLDPFSNRVIAAGVAGEQPVWFDEYFEAQQALLDEAFAGESPNVISWSEDRSRMVVRTESNDRAPAFHLYDARDASAGQLASTYPSLDGVVLPPRERYRYEARDGTRIPAFLTRPLAADGPGPLVVLPHGGPAVRESFGFDWLAHFMATRGYTVLQPDFRGSGGYGRAWEEAGHGQWGTGVMQHDVTDGVAALIAEGIADPERVCIVGASYGGYAALAGAAFTPELYRCAAAIAGVADLEVMLGFERGRAGGLSATVAYWQQAMGVTQDNRRSDVLRAISPARHAERITASVLLIHGVDDAVVPIDQSRRMESALRQAGGSVELVTLSGEDHWLSGAETRLETLRALERFLAQHLAD